MTDAAPNTSNMADFLPSKGPPSAIAEYIAVAAVRACRRRCMPPDCLSPPLAFTLCYLHDMLQADIHTDAGKLYDMLTASTLAFLMAPFAQMALLHRHRCSDRYRSYHHTTRLMIHQDYTLFAVAETRLHHLHALFQRYGLPSPAGEIGDTNLQSAFAYVDEHASLLMRHAHCDAVTNTLWETCVIAPGLLEAEESAATFELDIHPLLQVVHRLCCTCRASHSVLGHLLATWHDMHAIDVVTSADFEELRQPAPSTWADIILTGRHLSHCTAQSCDRHLLTAYLTDLQPSCLADSDTTDSGGHDGDVSD